MSTLFSTLKQFARDHYGDQADAKATRVIERAICSALRTLSQEHDWSFFIKRQGGRVVLTAPYSTGTVDVAQGGTGATLTGGTWPTGAVGGKLIFTANSNIEFEVGTRTSNSVIVFVSGQKWVEDAINDGTYTLYFDTYSLPSDFKELYYGQGEPITSMQYLDPDEFFFYRMNNRNSTADPPYKYTITSDDKMMVYPYPSSARVIEMAYVRQATLPTSDGDSIDWPDKAMSALHAGILVELAKERGDKATPTLGEAMAVYRGTVSDAWQQDSGRAKTVTIWGGGMPEPRGHYCGRNTRYK